MTPREIPEPSELCKALLEVIRAERENDWRRRLQEATEDLDRVFFEAVRQIVFDLENDA